MTQGPEFGRPSGGAESLQPKIKSGKSDSQIAISEYKLS
jgi:hypothetical protein